MPREIKVQVTAETGKARTQLSGFGAALNSLEGWLRKLGGPGNAVADVLDKLGTRGSAAAIGVGVAGAAIGAAAKIAEDAIGKYVELGDRIDDYSHVTGLSAEESSRQVIAFGELGVSADIASNAMFKLGKAAEGSEATLNKAGIAVARAADGSVDLNATLLNVINAWQGAGSAAEQDAIIFAAFGRAGQAMIPILKANSAELARLEAAVKSVYSEKDLAEVRQYKIALAELKQSSDDLGVSLGRLLLPAQKAVIDGINREVWISGQLAEERDKGTEATGRTVIGLRLEHEALGKTWDKAQAARAAMDELAASQLRDAQTAERDAQAQEDLYKAINSAVDAEFGYRDAMAAAAEAHAEQVKGKGQDVEANRRQEEAYYKVGEAAARLAEAKAKESGASFGARDAADAQIAAYRILEGTIKPGSALYKEIEGWIAKLDEIPRDVTTSIGLRMGPGVVSAQSRGGTVMHGNLSFDEGGTVPGPPGQPVMVQALGGEQFGGRQSIGAGRPVVVNINGGIFMDDGPTMDRLTNAIARAVLARRGT